MASTNIDRTAIVKLAVIGVPLKEGESSTKFQLNDQLHDFSYSVISDNTGDSYVFKLELINFDDTIHNTLLKAFHSSLNRDRKSNRLATEKDVLEGFPKLLIQWGYPDALSSIHIAQLSDLKYKFTQAKEKVLIIEAVNAGDWAGQFFMNANESFKLVAMDVNSDNPQLLGANKSISKIIFETFEGALNGIRGITTDATFSKLDYDKLDAEINDILTVLRDKQPPRMEKDTKENRDKNRKKNADLNYRALQRFFKLIGFEFRTIVSLDNFTSAVEQKRQLFPIFGNLLVKQLDGTYGEIISYIPKNQTNIPANFENLPAAAEAVNVKSTSSAFDINSGNEQITNNINNRVDLYNSTRPEGSSPVSPENVQISTTLDSNQLRKLRDGQNVNISITSVFAIDDSGEGVYNFPSKTGYITLTPSTTQDGVSQQDFAKSLNLEAVEKMQDENNKVTGEIVSETVTDRLGDDIEVREDRDNNMIMKRYSELSDLDKHLILYNSIKLKLYSGQNISVLTTIKNSISNFNKLMSTSDNHIFMQESGRVFRFPEFNALLEVLNSLQADSQYQASTGFRFTRGGRNTDISNNKLKTIKSFPNIHKEEDGKKLVDMSYGRSDSIVKYFDFTGDIRYLANMQASVATVESLDSVFSYLTRDAQLEHMNLIQFLIDSEDFRAKLTQRYKSDNAYIEQLEILKDQLDPNIKAKDVEGLDFNFLLHTNYISTYLKDNREGQTKSLKQQGMSDNDIDQQLTAQEVFFATISTSLGIKSLFQSREDPSKEPKVDILEKALAIEEGREPTVPNKSFTYVLLDNNTFDQYKNIKNKKLLNTRTLATLETLYNNLTEPWELKIKTLGIPEMDSLDDIIAPRYFDFEVHDLSKELQDNGNRHWLTGTYRPMAINHRINNSIGYVSEFTLLKDLGSI